MFNSNSMSPADLAAVTNGNNNGMWGDGSMLWWVLILVFFCFGNNGWGNNSGVQDQYTLASDFATLQRQIDSTATNTQNMVINNADQLQRQITAIGNGVSSLGYDQLSQMNGINQNIANSTYDIRNAIQSNAVANMQNTNAITAQLNTIASNQASCCCNTQNALNTGFADINYRLATDTCAITTNASDNARAIIDNSNANYRALDAKINDMQTQALQDKINTLTADNQALKFAASQQAQNAYLVSQLRDATPIPAYNVPNPYTGAYSNCPCSSCS